MKRQTYIMKGNAKEKKLDVYHLILAPTYACNLRCKHCYLPDHDNQLLPRHVVLRLIDEWSRIVVKERGVYGGIFHIKGGEPFVVPYLWDVLDRLAEIRTLQIFITTNGTFVSDSLFQKLRKYSDAVDNHLTIIVSLDGATEKAHAKLRGEGNYEKTLEFIKRLGENDINFHLNFVIHRENIDEIPEYINLAKRYGAAQINFLNFVPKGIGFNLRNWQVPHVEIYKRLKEIYDNSDNETKRMLAGNLPYIKSKEVLNGYSTAKVCVAGYRGLLYITPDGSVFPCPNITFSDYSIGNVINQSLEEILDNMENIRYHLSTHYKPYICAGEKILYETVNDTQRLKYIYELSDLLDDGEGKDGEAVAYCFSRNY